MAVPAPRRHWGWRGDRTLGWGRVMWRLTVPPLLLLLLLCSGLAGQVGARRAGAGTGGSRKGAELRGFPQKRGLGLHEPLRGCEGRRSQRGRGWNVHSGFGKKEGGLQIQPQAGMVWGTL